MSLEYFIFALSLEHKNPWVFSGCQRSLAGSNVLSYNYFWSVKDYNMFQSTITRCKRNISLYLRSEFSVYNL